MMPTESKTRPSGREAVSAVLDRRRPGRFVYAPNYWQWFGHHQTHGTLPDEIADCQTQLDVLEHLGVDIFSRNVYCDQRRCWYGGLAETYFTDVEVEQTETAEGDDRIFDRSYRTRAGLLTERQSYHYDQSTLVQLKFVVNDYANELDAYEPFVAGRKWRFLADKYDRQQQEVGDRGIVVAGELHGPLKMLHFDLGAQDTTFLLVDQPERAAELMAMHEEAQLDLVREMADHGVPAMMAMDNLDTAFHPPRYVEQY